VKIGFIVALDGKMVVLHEFGERVAGRSKWISWRQNPGVDTHDDQKPGR